MTVARAPNAGAPVPLTTTTLSPGSKTPAVNTDWGAAGSWGGSSRLEWTASSSTGPGEEVGWGGGRKGGGGVCVSNIPSKARHVWECECMCFRGKERKGDRSVTVGQSADPSTSLFLCEPYGSLSRTQQPHGCGLGVEVVHCNCSPHLVLPAVLPGAPHGYSPHSYTPPTPPDVNTDTSLCLHFITLLHKHSGHQRLPPPPPPTHTHKPKSVLQVFACGAA